MKLSVLIIAHDEEKYIAQCIESVLHQSVKPDEVVLVVHNSTDATKEIAAHYPIKVIAFEGPSGSAHARLRGLEEVHGEIVCCIDGDSIAQHNWIQILSQTLQNNNVLVGSWIIFKGSIFNQFSNIFNKYKSVSKDLKATVWLWGGSFAFWGKDKEKIKECWQKSLELSHKLHLSRNPDDYWLALMMQKYGSIEVTNKTYTVHHPKELTLIQEIKRNNENHRNGKKIREYFGTQ